MLVIITGDNSSGSREVLAALTKEALDRGCEVFYKGPDDFSFNGFKEFELDAAMDLASAGSLEGSTVVLDLVVYLLDSMSQASVNKFITYLVTTSSQGRLDVYIKANHIDDVNSRLKSYANFWVKCTSSSVDFLDLRSGTVSISKESLLKYGVLLKKSLLLEEPGTYRANPVLDRLARVCSS